MSFLRMSSILLSAASRQYGSPRTATTDAVSTRYSTYGVDVLTRRKTFR